MKNRFENPNLKPKNNCRKILQYKTHPIAIRVPNKNNAWRIIEIKDTTTTRIINELRNEIIFTIIWNLKQKFNEPPNRAKSAKDFWIVARPEAVPTAVPYWPHGYEVVRPSHKLLLVCMLTSKRHRSHRQRLDIPMFLPGADAWRGWRPTQPKETPIIQAVMTAAVSRRQSSANAVFGLTAPNKGSSGHGNSMKKVSRSCNIPQTKPILA